MMVRDARDPRFRTLVFHEDRLSRIEGLRARLCLTLPMGEALADRGEVLIPLLRVGAAGVERNHLWWPSAISQRHPLAHAICVAPDHVLLAHALAEETDSAEMCDHAYNAFKLFTRHWLIDHEMDFRILQSGAVRPGFVVDPEAARDRPVFLPRARLGDVESDAQIYFQKAPLLTAAEWIERAAALPLLPEVTIPTPPRSRNLFHRLIHRGASS